MTNNVLPPSDAVNHFTQRASKYATSAHWCDDASLMEQIVKQARPSRQDRLLDVACGTGLVARAFHGKVREIIGLDLTPAMSAQASSAVNAIVLASAEAMPLPDCHFDLAICRQGIQFMNVERAVGEMVRVTRPGGRIVLANICAYSHEDKAEYCEILRLRNPARKHCFMAEDLLNVLTRLGCTEVQSQPYISRENIKHWSDNGAIASECQRRIQQMYLNASPSFRRLHRLEYLGDDDIIDHMLFCVAVGTRA